MQSFCKFSLLFISIKKLSEFSDWLTSKGDGYYKARDDFDRIIEFLDKEDMSNELAFFKEKTLKLDQIRNENFLKTFPELAELFTETTR